MACGVRIVELIPALRIGIGIARTRRTFVRRR
jgi:hypothetical protein